jgi:tRNA 2-thiouridine synthesizing protein A
MDEQPIAATLDISLDLCPMTFVKTKLELEEMAAGELLEVILRAGEPLKNVTRSCEEEGHAVLERAELPSGLWRLVIQRGGD